LFSLKTKNHSENLSSDIEQFEARKRDHIKASLDDRSQVSGFGGFDQINFTHEALPELDFKDLNLGLTSLHKNLNTPFYVSSMTAGHAEGVAINRVLMAAASKKGWAMGVGSQRRELSEPQAALEWQTLRAEFPEVVLFGNLGISQIITTEAQIVAELLSSLSASGLFIHVNPLQECIQPEGTPNFKGAISSISRLVKSLKVPVIIKEVGTGFSRATMSRIADTGVAAIDVSGMGGTHWGRVEGLRGEPGQEHFELGKTFANWGISTVDSVLQARELGLGCEIWGSGGIRSGLDAAKVLALGCKRVGVAQPLLIAAIKELAGESDSVIKLMELFEKELKIAMFCTGSGQISELSNKWQLRAPQN
jgi:isopentenyl-diphosphate Delta-isomerase